MPGRRAGRRSSVPVGDLVLGCALTVLSLAVIVSAVRMPRARGWDEAPGLFPLILGVGLLGMALFLTTAALRARHAPVRPGSPESGGEPAAPERGRTLLVVGSVLVYVLVLIPLLHYTVATVVYLVALIWYFWRGSLVWTLAIALAGALFLAQTFEHVFAVILP